MAAYFGVMFEAVRHEPSLILLFINRIKYAEHKIFCICLDLYKF